MVEQAVDFSEPEIVSWTVSHIFFMAKRRDKTSTVVVWIQLVVHRFTWYNNLSLHIARLMQKETVTVDGTKQAVKCE